MEQLKAGDKMQNRVCKSKGLIRQLSGRDVKVNAGKKKIMTDASLDTRTGLQRGGTHEVCLNHKVLVLLECRALAR